MEQDSPSPAMRPVDDIDPGAVPEPKRTRTLRFTPDVGDVRFIDRNHGTNPGPLLTLEQVEVTIAMPQRQFERLALTLRCDTATYQRVAARFWFGLAPKMAERKGMDLASAAGVRIVIRMKPMHLGAVAPRGLLQDDASEGLDALIGPLLPSEDTVMLLERSPYAFEFESVRELWPDPQRPAAGFVATNMSEQGSSALDS